MAASDFQPIDYLASKGYQGKKGSTGEWSYPCFLGCLEAPDSRKRKLYVNEHSGFFHCKVCEIKGGPYVLMSHFGDAEADGSTPVPQRSKILEQATEIGQAMLEQNDDLMLYLIGERGLSAETVVARRLGFVGNRWSLVGNIKAKAEDLLETGLVYIDGPRKGKDFFYDHLLIPYVRNGRVVQLRGRAMGGQASGRYMTGPGERVRLFNEDSLDGADDVVVVEGEFDAMILAQHLALSTNDRIRRYGVVGLAGANAIPEDFDAALKDAKRVFLALDPDDVGKGAAIKLKDRLGARGRIVELPEDTPQKADWTYLLTEGGWTWRDAVAAMGDAQGKRVFSVPEVYDSWRNSEAHQGEGIATGFEQFDHVITPGLLPGQLLVLLAKTGTGKTIWLCNVAWNMREHHVLFCTLEQTREEVYERLQRIARFHNPTWSDREVNASLSRIGIVDQNRLNEQDLHDLIEEYEVEMGARPEVVMVDYLGYFARGVNGRSPYEKASNAVMSLKAAAKRDRVVMIAPHQVNRLAKEGKPIDMDDARDSGVIEETADFLLAIFRPDDAKNDTLQNDQPSGVLRMSVLKSRHGGKDRVFSLQMDLLTLAIVDAHTPEAKQAQQHTYLYWRGTTYDDLRREQTKPVQMQMGASA